MFTIVLSLFYCTRFGKVFGAEPCSKQRGPGSPRIQWELSKLGFELCEATVAKYMVRHRKAPAQTWRSFLANHMKDMAYSDFFVVPTVFFRVLFVFVILSHAVGRYTWR